MFGLRMFAKIYDFQKTNQKHEGTLLKIELDKDLLCETGSKTLTATKTATMIIVAISVVALFVIIAIVGFFITKKMRKNKENIDHRTKNNELDDIADMEQQWPIVKQVSK